MYLSKVKNHNYESYYIQSCCSSDEEEITDLLQKSIEANPLYFEAYNKQAEIYYQNKQYDKVFTLYNSLLDKITSNKELTLECLIKIAGFQIRLKDYQNCIETLDSCLIMNNNEEVLLMKAQALLFLEKFTEAENCYLTLIKNNSDESYYAYAIFLNKTKKLEKSIEMLNKTLIINPYHNEALQLKSLILNELGRFEEAKEVKNKVNNAYGFLI